MISKNLKGTIVLSFLAFIIFFNSGYSQPSSGVITSDTIIIAMEKVTGLGPGGDHSISQSPKSAYNKEERKLFPVVKNMPEDLDETVEYYFVLDDFQFYYQNYCAGRYEKSLFIKKADQSEWNLADTSRLSREPVLCGFSVYAGFTPSHDPLYIIDSNGNSDFSDDALRPLTKGVNDPDRIVAQAVAVQTTYYRDKKLVKEEILVHAQKSRWGDENKLALSFTFPEFRYSKFSYEGESYIICMDAYQYRPTISILPDKPFFSRVSEDKKVEVNQFVVIGGETFQFIGHSENGNKISLLRSRPINVKDDRSATWGIANEGNNNVQSSQVGFKAPVVSGREISSNQPLSSGSLKGKYAFIDFWSTSCGPCIAEFKFLKEAYSKFDRSQFEIVGVVDERRQGATQEILKKHGVTWPNIKANSNGTVTAGYNVVSYPTTYLIDPTGKIIAKNLRGEELMNLLRTLIKK